MGMNGTERNGGEGKAKGGDRTDRTGRRVKLKEITEGINKKKWE
jgi:hypothetical protein